MGDGNRRETEAYQWHPVESEIFTLIVRYLLTFGRLSSRFCILLSNRLLRFSNFDKWFIVDSVGKYPSF